MKTIARLAPALFALVGFFVASPLTQAAPKKADERTAALVAALQAVSPDPLGGRFGLAASTARTEPKPATASFTSPTQSGLTAQAARAIIDQRAYVIWKSSQKS